MYVVWAVVCCFQSCGDSWYRYNLQFQAQREEEILKRKFDAKTVPLVKLEEELRGSSVEEFHPTEIDLDIPKRPPWHFSMPKDELEHQERMYFDHYLMRMHSIMKQERLSHFEHNLEVCSFKSMPVSFTDCFAIYCHSLSSIHDACIVFSPGCCVLPRVLCSPGCCVLPRVLCSPQGVLFSPGCFVLPRVCVCVYVCVCAALIGIVCS